MGECMIQRMSMLGLSCIFLVVSIILIDDFSVLSQQTMIDNKLVTRANAKTRTVEVIVTYTNFILKVTLILAAY